MNFKYNNNRNNNNFITKDKRKNKIKKDRKKHKITNFNINNNFDNIITESSKEKNKFKNMTNDLMLNNNIHNKNILEYKDDELNSLSFKRAIIQDKRNLCQYYISSIKINNLLIFSFLPVKDYDSMTIKNFLFFFFFTLNLTVNALFFNDDTMHKIYIDEGKYNIIYQLPQIIYSTIISGIVGSLIKYLSLSQDNIMELKYSSRKNLGEKHKKLLLYLKIKFIFFLS